MQSHKLQCAPGYLIDNMIGCISSIRSRARTSLFLKTVRFLKAVRLRNPSVHCWVGDLHVPFSISKTDFFQDAASFSDQPMDMCTKTISFTCLMFLQTS